MPQLPAIEFGYGATAQVKVIFDFSLFWIGASLDLDVSIEGELGVGIRFEQIDEALDELPPIRIPKKLWSLPFDLIGFNINATVDLGLSFGVRDLEFHFPAFNYYKGYLYKISKQIKFSPSLSTTLNSQSLSITPSLVDILILIKVSMK